MVGPLGDDAHGVLDGVAGVSGELGAHEVEVLGEHPEGVDDATVPADAPRPGGDGGAQAVDLVPEDLAHRPGLQDEVGLGHELLPATQAMIDSGYEDFAHRWNPVLDVFDGEVVRFSHEVHPREIAYDYWTTHAAFDAIEHRKRSASTGTRRRWCGRTSTR